MSQAEGAGGQLSRRRILQLAGAGIGAGTLGVSRTGEVAAWDWQQEAGEIACSTPGGYVARELTGAIDEGGNLCTGQTVEPGSSTPEAIAESWFRTGMYAKEHDAVTLQTIWNRLEDARTIAYVRAKSAALEAINNGESESFVTDTAKSKIDEHYSTIQTNLLNHWKVQANKIRTYAQEVEAHSEISAPGKFAGMKLTGMYSGSNEKYFAYRTPKAQTITVTLLDGNTMDVKEIGDQWTETPDGSNTDYNVTFWASPAGYTSQVDNSAYPNESELEDVKFSYRIPSTELSGVDTTHLAHWMTFVLDADPETVSEANTAIGNGESFSDWDELNQYIVLWNKITDQHSQMISNIETWVSNAYGSVQAGEETVASLVAADPYVLAQDWATDYQNTGHLAYAAADLAVMGLSFDSDHKMVLQLDDGTELEGTLYTSNDTFQEDVGVEIDPSARSEDFYVAADTSTMQRALSDGEYRDSIDGGVAKLNTGVSGSTQYVIETTHGETVTVPWDDWSIEDTTANQDVEMIQNADSVVVDLSDELDEPVTSIEKITALYLGDEEAVVLQLTDPFTILEAYDVETGEEVGTVSGQGYNAGDSTVDLSWTESYLEMRDNTDAYAEDSGGGGGGVGFNWSAALEGGTLGSLIGAAGALVALYLGWDIFLNDDS